MLTEVGSEACISPTSDADVLVVLLHAFNQTPESLRRVADVVKEAYPQSEIFAPVLPVSTFSSADPNRIAVELVTAIDELDRARQSYPDTAGFRCII